VLSLLTDAFGWLAPVLGLLLMTVAKKFMASVEPEDVAGRAEPIVPAAPSNDTPP
jgi:hypothetical protein